MKTTTFAAALLASALAIAPALAQTAGQHDEHHPGQPEATAPAPAAPAPIPPPTSQPGMPGMPMMNMMGGGMDMAGMMRMMNMMRSGMGGDMDGMGAFDRIEGRIAFLRAELRITDAQTPVWNVFADALRTQAQKLRQMSSAPADRNALQNGLALLDRLDRQERLLSARIEGVRSIKSALAPLLAALSDEQKKTADELLGAHFGVPAMGGAMMSGSGMMGGGMMQGGMKPAMGR